MRSLLRGHPVSHMHGQRFHLAIIDGSNVRAACGDSDPSTGWTPTLRAVTCEDCLARLPALLFLPVSRTRPGRQRKVASGELGCEPLRAAQTA